MPMRIEEMTALRPGLFDTFGTNQDIGENDPSEFQAPTEAIQGTEHGLNVEHSRLDLNKGAGIRL